VLETLCHLRNWHIINHGSGFYGLYYKHQNKLTQGRDYTKLETYPALLYYYKE